MTQKIMVVDDNAGVRRMVRNALVRHGHIVIEAADGRSARELMRRERPRLVLQDLILPDADGFELVTQLRELVPDCSILAFSGFVSKLDEARVSTVGFDDIIPKPILPSRLVPIVEAHLPIPIAADERFGAGKRLVVADDDPMQLKLASFRLGRLGFAVETAPDGAAALAAIRRQRPAVVVSDVMMPELDGFGLAMALRSDPELATLPLLLVTSSYVEPTDRELARRAGANDLVVRTPELAELIELLRATLSQPARPPVLPPEAVDALERERGRRVMRQLERQVMLNTGLAKRCSALASELTVLGGISDAVLRDRDIEAALDEALATCFDAGGIAAGALYLPDDAGELRARPLGSEATWQPSALASFFGHPELLQRTIATGEPLQLLSPDDTSDLLSRSGATALLLVPLVHATGPTTRGGALLVVARGRDIDMEDWRAFAEGVAGQIVQALALARAYADREAAERKAEQHAALLAAIVDSAPDIVLHVAIDGTIRFANRPVRGVPASEVIGTSLFARLPAHQVAEIRSVFERVVQTGEPAGYETHGLAPEGRPGTYSVRLGPVMQEGKVVAVVVIARDVTEKKQAEMQLMLADRMASVGTLAAGVAHEINNPLAAVIANLDMAVVDVGTLGEKVALPADLAEELRDARLASERVREIVRDLKIFSRAHEDRRGAVDVVKVLDSTIRMAWNELRHRAKVVKDYARIPRVDANESRLGQVFLNLIVNAAQAIPEGKYESNQIRIATVFDRGRVHITIADTGPGMPPHVQARLFTPFFTTKPIGVGTGLGLAISHRIVSQLGGTLTFTSEPGKGTEFRVTLPVAEPGLPTITQSLPGVMPARRRGRVLVIDDEETLTQAMRRFLQQDHDTEAVSSARAALDLVMAGSRYDVILCDLMMPQITGMDFYSEMFKLERAQADRIVFITGGAFTETARQFLDATPNRKIEKPFDLKALRSLVNELIG